MSDSEKSRLRALRLFFVGLGSSQIPVKRQTGECQLESCGIIHSPAVGRLSITVCESCPDIFVSAKVILLFLLKDTALKISSTALTNSRSRAKGTLPAVWRWRKGTASLPQAPGWVFAGAAGFKEKRLLQKKGSLCGGCRAEKCF